MDEKVTRNTLERIIELSANMENLIGQVTLMDKKLDEIRTDHVATTNSNIAVLQSKINRLETIIYGTLGLAGIEGLTLLVTILAK